MPDYTDVLIIGGGLAGSCAALQLAKRGAMVQLVHLNNESGHTASRVPLALYNPAAALRARKGWEAEACHTALHDLIGEVADFSGNSDFVSKTGVLRPCLDEGMAAQFRKSVETENWPDGWVSWLEPEEIKARFPESEHRWGGLWVPVGMTIDTPALLNGLHRLLLQKYDCRIAERKAAEIRSQDYGAEVFFEDGGSIKAAKVILAAGAFSKKLTGQSELKLHSVKGQTTEVYPFLPSSFLPSVSSKGYISLHNNRVVIGSTYEHHFKDFEPSSQSESYLLQKVPLSFPGINLKDIQMKQSWAGIRVTTPDRLPLVGPLTADNSCYIHTGFGSKGVMYAPYCSVLLAEQLINQKDIPHEISVTRQQFPGDEL